MSSNRTGLRVSLYLLALLVTNLLAADTRGAAARPERAAAPPPRARSQGPLPLPMAFEPNVGQADPRAKYVARGRGYAVHLTPEGVALRLTAGGMRPGPDAATPDARRADLRLEWVGGSRSARLAAAGELPGRSNYLVGPDRSKWRTGIPTYAGVRCEGVYEGVDVVFYGDEQRLAYDFVVAPGADPSQIRVRFEGADRVTVEEDGSLRLELPGGTVRQTRALVYQEEGGARRAVAARYVAGGDAEVGFDFGEYDASRPLVVDPVLEYAAFFGEVYGYDSAASVATDASGAIYVVGETSASNLPTAGALDATFAGLYEAFVAKVSPDGQTLLWATYLGGAGDDRASDIAVGADGHVYVVGETRPGAVASADVFPTTPGAFTGAPQGNVDAFVTKLSPSGDALAYSTLLGGAGFDSAVAVAVGPDGYAYVAAYSARPEGGQWYPVTAGSYQPAYRGPTDMAVTKVGLTGTGLIYSTFLGGTASDQPFDLALGAAGTAYVVGATASATYPTTPGAYDASIGGFQDAVVTQVNAEGTGLVFSTYLGGASSPLSEADEARAVAVDASGVYVAGRTASLDFPTTAGAYDTSHAAAGYDAFAAKLSPDATSLVYSTFLGGEAGDDLVRDVAPGASGTAYVVGETASADFPTTAGAYDTTPNGGLDAFAARLSADGSSLVYATLAGGRGDDSAAAVVVDATGAAIVAGAKGSTDFPRVGGLAAPPDRTDAFVLELSPEGDALAFSGSIGGNTGPFSTGDRGTAVAVGTDGSAYVAGGSSAAGDTFPTTSGAAQPEPAGASEAVILRVSPDGQTLLYSTFLGGSSFEQGHAIAVDATGAAYVTGQTYAGSVAFPTTPGAYDATPNGENDLFVAKLSPDGASLVYATLLGGGHEDENPAIAVDAAGAAYVVAWTRSVDYPTMPGAFDTGPGLSYNAVVTKLSVDGTSLAYSTFLGGDGADFVYDVAVDGNGAAFITGSTRGPTQAPYPTTPGAFDTTYGTQDVFVTKLSPDGASLAYSTFLGQGFGIGIVVDAAGAAFVVGGTSSSEFPVTASAYDRTLNGSGGDAFAAKLAPDGSSLSYSTYLGGSGIDLAHDVAADAAGHAYVVGHTIGAFDFPTTPDAYSTTYGGGVDAFVARLDAGGSTLLYSTYFGGPADDAAAGVALGPDGDVYFAGTTASPTFATGGFGFADAANGFVARLRLGAPAPAEADTAGVYVPESGVWFLKNSNAGGGADLVYQYGPGGAGYVPLPGDWDGDGADTPGIYNPSDGSFLLKDANAPGPATRIVSFGPGGADFVPLAGDWDGDGDDSLGVYAAATGTFFLKNTIANGPADLVFSFGPGGGGFVPLAGDWNGNGTDTVGVYATATGTFFLTNENVPGGADRVFGFGPADLGWQPLVGDWNGDGVDTVGLYAPSTGFFFLKDSNAPGPADRVFGYGPAGSTPVVGNWNGL